MYSLQSDVYDLLQVCYGMIYSIGAKALDETLGVVVGLAQSTMNHRNLSVLLCTCIHCKVTTMI